MEKTITVVVKQGDVPTDDNDRDMTVHLVDVLKGQPELDPKDLVGYTVTGAIICSHGNLLMELKKNDD